MRILIDENMGSPVLASRLRAQGHDNREKGTGIAGWSFAGHRPTESICNLSKRQ